MQTEMRFRSLLLPVIFLWLFSANSVGAQSFFDFLGGGLLDTEKAKEQHLFGDKSAPEKILIFKLDGMIISQEESPNPFQQERSLLSITKTNLKGALKDDKIKGVVIEVDSPGGEATESDIIYNEIERFKKKSGKKVVVYFRGLAASGGYYIGCGGDKIIAHPSTITGSIGVIIKTFNIVGMMEKIGLKDVTLKSTATPMKDILSSTREMTPEEKTVLMEIVDNMYDIFTGVVSKSRNLPMEEVRKLADGRLFTSKRALENKLIDKIGYLEDAFDLCKELCGLKEANGIKFKKRASLSQIFSLLGEQTAPGLSAAFQRLEAQLPFKPGLYTLWQP